MNHFNILKSFNAAVFVAPAASNDDDDDDDDDDDGDVDDDDVTHLELQYVNFLCTEKCRIIESGNTGMHACF